MKLSIYYLKEIISLDEQQLISLILATVNIKGHKFEVHIEISYSTRSKQLFARAMVTIR